MMNAAEHTIFTAIQAPAADGMMIDWSGFAVRTPGAGYEVRELCMMSSELRVEHL